MSTLLGTLRLINQKKLCDGNLRDSASTSAKVRSLHDLSNFNYLYSNLKFTWLKI